MIAMRRLFFSALLAGLALAESAGAQNPVFSLPDAPLPAAPGTGLSGSIWSSPDIAPVDDLAAARAYLISHSPDTLFAATSIDYPNGPTGIISTDTTLAAGLGVDAASLSNPLVGSASALNSIFKMNGYLRVETAGTLTLGVGSDDGSELLIQGVQIQNNDGLHDFPGAAPVAIDFTAPGLYEVEILFFESQASGWGLEFYLGSGGAGTPVPTASLYPVPEPGALALVAMGGVASAWGMRRRRPG
jgi:hypothetical protein